MSVDNGVVLTLFGTFPRDVGNPQRTSCKNLKQFKSFIEYNNGSNDCFVSIYDLSLIIDKIFYDFDGDDSLEDIQKFTLYLHIKNYPFIVLVSGKKGYHVYVLFKPIMDEDNLTKKDLLSKASFGLLLDCFGKDENKINCKTADTHVIGDVRRLARIPNTKHPRANGYCTYLPFPQLLTWDESDVQLWIKEKREGRLTFSGDRFPSILDFPQASDELLKYNVQIEYDDDLGSVESHELLKDLLRPCLYRHMMHKNPCHEARLATALDLLQIYSPSTVIKFFSELSWSNFDASATLYHLERLSGLKPYSCSKLREIGIPRECCIE